MSEDLGSVAPLATPSVASPSLANEPATPSYALSPMANGPAAWAAILNCFPEGAIIAGGAVRDFALGVEPKDIDVFLPCTSWPRGGLEPLGRFESLGTDRNDDYSAMPAISIVQRGRLYGHQIDVVGLWFEDENYRPERIVSTFDFGISRCWFDGEIHDTPEAESDRRDGTVTLLLTDRPERASIRFARFNERMGGGYSLRKAPEGVATKPTADGEASKRVSARATEPNQGEV